MEYLRLFEDFKNNYYGTSGVVFIYGSYILLVRSTYGDWSYPKGKVDDGEEIIDAAIREVSEEIGVIFPKEKLIKVPLMETKPSKRSKGLKHFWYYRYELNIDEFEEYFNSLYEIPKGNLQTKEIDKAVFVPKKVAKKLLGKRFSVIV